MCKLLPINNNVKILIKNNKKTESGILIQSEEKNFHKAYISAIGETATKNYPILQVNQRVELINNVILNLFKENNEEFCLIDASSIIGYYEDYSWVKL
jgi:co-chaperonin GroES (HSP10)